jgi:hypothetical protein
MSTSKSTALATDKLAKLLKLYKDKPLVAMEQLFQVVPDAQQASLIETACKPGCRIAVKSAQGAGKTSTLVWLTLYFLLVLDDCRILVTSPSANQLHRVFHAEALKWVAKMPPVFKDFFEITTKRINIVGRPFQKADLVTASAENQENLAGGHSENYVILADEASAIEEPVFDVLQGTLGTGSGGRFIMTANPVRNSGRFYEIFSRKPEIWSRITFDARHSGQINKSWIKEMADFYGEDSDRYKTRVLAEFPRASEEQFIPTGFVEEAIERNLMPSAYRGFPKVMGCDVARFGSDETVFVLRQGPKILDTKRYNGLDTTEVAAHIVDFFHMHQPEAIYIDAIGIGAGVFDQCQQFGLPVVEVVVSQRSSNPKEYFNLRSQLWGEMRGWLQNGADIPNDPELQSQMCGMTYNYNGKLQMQMANKKDLKKQGLASPDIPDAISLTFAPNTRTYSPAMKQKRNVIKSTYHWV